MIAKPARSALRLVMVFMFCLFMWFVSIQEFSFFLLFPHFVRCLRVQALHLLLLVGGKLRQVTDESHEFP